MNVIEPNEFFLILTLFSKIDDINTSWKYKYQSKHVSK